MIRRPRFIMHKHTEMIIALNALQYADTPAGQIPERNKGFESALNLPTIYQGLSCKPLYSPPEVLELKLQLYLKSSGRNRIKGKKKIDMGLSGKAATPDA